MKKIAFSLVVILLLLAGTTAAATPPVSLNNGVTEQIIEAIVPSKHVTAIRKIYSGSLVPSSIFYTSGGYEGVLYLDYVEVKVGYVIAHYSGTVYWRISPMGMGVVY